MIFDSEIFTQSVFLREITILSMTDTTKYFKSTDVGYQATPGGWLGCSYTYKVQVCYFLGTRKGKFEPIKILNS